jgi:S1-C subfamily serine protease
VPLAEKEPVLGAKLIWTGYPLGLDFMMGLGIAGNPNYQTPMLGEGYWLAVYGQFIPGNSGGPVFNGKGELVGIVSSLMATPGHAWPVGIAAPLSVLKNHLH